MRVENPSTAHGLRLAELLAAVSLATDLAHDVAAESALRDAVLTVELARYAGWPDPDVADAYYLALLYHIGCTGAVAAQSRLGGGDDVNVRRWMSEADYADRPGMMRIAVTKLAPRWGSSGWTRGMAAFATAGRDMPEAFANIAEVAARLSDRLGAGPRVTELLCYAYARWDGKVFPLLPSGDGLPAIARLVHLVHVAQVYHQVGGVAVADAVVRQRSGSEFDPELARLWLQTSHDLLPALSEDSVWDQALSAEPEPHRRVSAQHLDEVSAGLADFVDLASPYTAGHSTRVARLAEAAAMQRRPRRRRGRHRAAGGAGARPRDGECAQPRVDQEWPAQPGGVGAGAHASAPHTPDPQPGRTPSRRGHHRGSPPRAARRVRLPPRRCTAARCR